MEIKNSFAAGVQAIQRGMAGLDEDARAIAQATAQGEGQEAGPLVAALQDRVQVEAGAKVVSILDETLGTLFDEKA